MGDDHAQNPSFCSALRPRSGRAPQSARGPCGGAGLPGAGFPGGAGAAGRGGSSLGGAGAPSGGATGARGPEPPRSLDESLAPLRGGQPQQTSSCSATTTCLCGGIVSCSGSTCSKGGGCFVVCDGVEHDCRGCSRHPCA